MSNILFAVALIVAIYFTFWCVGSLLRGHTVHGLMILIMAVSVAAVVTRFMGFWG